MESFEEDTMEEAKQIYKNVVSAINAISKLEDDTDKFVKISSYIASNTSKLVSLSQPSNESPKVANESQESPVVKIQDQVDRLHSAAIIPAQNYRRIATITNKLRGLVKIASLPQNASIRPRVTEVVQKVAGIFSEIDTVQDLDKPLEQIEKAVHALYGDQSKNSTYNFEQRGKGSHSKS